MQSIKGLVRFFAIALILASLYHLSFNWMTSNVESKAEAYAKRKAKALGLKENSDDYLEKYRQNKSYYLDSMTNKEIFMGITYQKAKDQQLGLGLDLKGGMNVVLQLKVEDLLRTLSNNSQNPQFLEAIKQAKAASAGSRRDFITLFGEAWNKVAPGAKLSGIFATLENQNNIKFESSNDDVLKFLKQQSEGAIENTEKIIRNRIDKFGVTNPNVFLDKQTGRITVELPGVENPERMRKILQATAQLEFYETYENGEFVENYLSKANTLLGKKNTGNTLSDSTATENADTSKTKSLSDLLQKDNKAAASDTSKEAKMAKARSENPIFAKLSLNVGRDNRYGPGPVVGIARSIDTAEIMKMLNSPDAKSVLPRNVKLVWSAKGENNVFQLLALRTTSAGLPQLDGSVVTETGQEVDQFTGKNEVRMVMNAEGAREWKRITGQNVGKSVAIVLDNAAQSWPTVNGEIAGGTSSISGNFTTAEAIDLANILKSGKLPVGTQIIEEGVVGPTLGEKAISSGLMSMGLSLLLIIGFMLLYYSTSGLMAIAALLLNIIFILGSSAALGTVLTMPGIAGLVLTIGMAVDANVIIYERIKEELAEGKTLLKAISDGFLKSYSSIIDANVAVLISGIVMIVFGIGLIKGFAWILVIGIITSLFSAVLITRLLIDLWVEKKGHLNFYTKASEGLFKNINFDFVGKRKMFYVISTIIIGAGLISMFTRGFNLGVDFQGGRSYVVKFNSPMDADKLSDALKPVFGGMAPVVKTYGSNSQYKITTSYGLSGETSVQEEKIDELIYNGLKPMLGDATYEQFKSRNLQSTSKIGPLIASDIKASAWTSGLLSLLLIAVYIFIRFRKWQYSFGAILAVLHDALVVLAVWSLFKDIFPWSMELDQTIISAILTIIGYSMNDNVVIFDRIREMLKEHPAMPRAQLINEAINKTLSRTTMTAFTVLLVVVILLIFGGEVLRGFSFAMLVGLISGTYSTIFVASPMLIDLDKNAK